MKANTESQIPALLHDPNCIWARPMTRA